MRLPRPEVTAAPSRAPAPPEAFCSTPSEVRVDGELDLSGRAPAVVRATVEVRTECAFHVLDVTDHAARLVARSGVRDGQVTAYTPHTTCAVRINERETGFLDDLRRVLEELVPSRAYYRHDDLSVRTENVTDPAGEPLNGHAHIKAMLLGTASETVPVVDGRLLLGTWQRILLIELDRPRARRLHLQVQGWR